MKWSLTSLITRGIQIKTRYNCIPTMMATALKLTNVEENVEKLELVYTGGNVKWCRWVGKWFGISLNMLSTDWPQNSAISFLGT